LRLVLYRVGLTVLLFTACQTQNPPEGFRQPTMSGATETGADAPNETTPKTVDSLEVGDLQTITEIHALSGSVLMGDIDAKVRLVMYDDYSCFYCGEFGMTDLQWAEKTYVSSKKISIERVFVPSTPAGMLMAKTALCSAKQNLFPETDRALHTNPISTEAQLASVAKKVKLNLKSLQSCVAAKKTAIEVQTATDRAKAAS
jgi:protein-disulfide isomerase